MAEEKKIVDNISVSSFLTSIGLEELRDIFEKEQITMDILFEMGHDKLKDIGIDADGHRNKILKGLDKMVSRKDFDENKERQIYHQKKDVTIESNKLCLILVGKTGSGKSALGNNISQYNTFCAGLCPGSTTKEVQTGNTTRMGYDITIVDTPGFYHTDMTERDVKKCIISAISKIHTGSCVILFVWRIGRHSGEDIGSFKKFCDYFGDDLLKNTILVFTHADLLESIEDYTNNVFRDYKQLEKHFRGKTIAFDNSKVGLESNKQFEELICAISKMHESSKNSHFCSTFLKYRPDVFLLRNKFDLLLFGLFLLIVVICVGCIGWYCSNPNSAYKC